MIQPDIDEIRRYLGMSKAVHDPVTDGMIQECIGKLQAVIQPVHLYAYYPLTITDDTFHVASLCFSSKSLRRNMEGCKEICVLACTIGIGADRLIRKTELTSISEAAVMQATAAAMAEAYCEHVNDMIKEETAQRNLYCRPRFSPGYGDLSLTLQKDIFSLLNLTKNLGITLSESLLMIPTKSITALIGISDTCRSFTQNQCNTCNMQNTCNYTRKDEL